MLEAEAGVGYFGVVAIDLKPTPGSVEGGELVPSYGLIDVEYAVDAWVENVLAR